MKKFTVAELKIRLDKYLAKQLPEFSRGKIQKDIEAGHVKVNGEVITSPHFAVRKDNEISYAPTEVVDDSLEPKNIPLKTLYNNHGLLIIDKPAGLVVHPGAGFKGDSLAQALLYHFKDIRLVGEEGRSGIVHRLDKDTSGVMMVALTQEIYEHLKDAFAERKVKKEYIALVCGKMPQSHGFFEEPLGKSKKDFRKYTTNIAQMVAPKPSLTEYRVLEYLSSPPHKEGEEGGGGVDFYSLVVVKLHTGRTHQIRVHFSSHGFPLVGDELYGGKSAMKLNLGRQFLHAKKIEVQLPDESWIEAVSELPKDLKTTLSNLDSKKAMSL
ncbi:MAG TPA: RluA family pseudouridine synthase [Candidatus Doudnabacteria bacterium]|nr:RluA family pseudouridine synthase [Candidatus Doudnabacteria bacterium]